MTITQPVELDWDDVRDSSVSWTRALGPVTRLYQDAQLVYGNHLRRCWDFCASPMVKDHEFRLIDGWLYRRGPEFDEDAVQRLAKWQQHVQGFLARGQNWYEVELKPEVVEIVERLRKHPRPTRPLAELVAHLEECIEAYGYIMGDLHWRMAAGFVRTDEGPPRFDWPDTYAEITGRPASEASALVGGLTNEMSKTIRRLRRLARLAASDGDLLKAVETGDPGALDDDRPAFKKFRSAFRSLLRTSGHRTGAGWGSSVTFGAPTWNVRPEIPLKMIATYARSDLDEVERKERDAARERKRLVRTVRRELKNDEQRSMRFEIELAIATARAYLMEDHNEWMDQSSPGLLRDAAHIVGLRLVRDGVIDDPTDVLHLSLDELRSPPSDARAIVAERKKEFQRQMELDPPKSIGEGEASEPPEMNDEGEGRVGNTLRGIAASSGRYTGRARVCLPAPIPPDVEDGDILVAIDAGPDWTPVFAILGAVVLDKGAAWQHASVVAREYGIPAVTGTIEGTTAIKDGQTITVDGDAGVVEF